MRKPTLTADFVLQLCFISLRRYANRRTICRSDEGQQWCCSASPRENGVSPMKTILSALIALSVLAGFAGTAAANVDAKTFYDQVDRNHF